MRVTGGCLQAHSWVARTKFVSFVPKNARGLRVLRWSGKIWQGAAGDVAALDAAWRQMRIGIPINLN